MSKTLIIIPCYNEEKRLPYLRFESYMNSEIASNLLFVNDGSSDRTINVLNKLKAEFSNLVEVLDLEKNVGKAEAIRQGILQCNSKEFEYLGYFDADLATPLSEIERLFEYTQREITPYIVMGCRIKLLGSTYIKRKLRRHYIGRVFATVVSNMLKLPIYDTQCGAKLIKSEVAVSLFTKKFITKWMFDIELLFRLKNQFEYKEGRIIEVPLKTWEDVAGSKIGFTYHLKAPLDLLKIYFKYS